MGWNKQEGEAWVLQRAIVRTTVPLEKMLTLEITGPLTIADAEQLAMALEREVEAARKSPI